jgi:hypothetical protein
VPSGFLTPTAESFGAWLLAGAAAPVIPDGWWLGLLSTPPLADGTGSAEPSSGSVHRANTARSPSVWPKVAAATYQNAAQINFGTATSTFSCADVGLFSAASQGALWFSVALDKSRTFSNGASVSLPPGSVVFNFQSSLQSGLTVPAAEAWGNALFQGATLPAYPSAWSLRLLSAAAALDGTGFVEVSDPLYSRASLTRSSSVMPKTDAALWQNAGSLTFGSVASPYTPIQVGFFDAPAGGTPVAVGALSGGTAPVGAQVQLPGNALSFRLQRGHSLSLAWDLVNDPTVTSYRVQYGLSSGVYTTSIDVGNTDHYRLANLTSGHTYYVAVKAVNTAGESLVSNQVFQAF